MNQAENGTIQTPASLEKKRSPFWRLVLDLFETLFLAILLFVVINSLTARIRVDGFSMEPTLHSGEFILVNKLAYKLGSPKTGDVVVFRYPRDPQQEFIKRVIGIPGDHVQIANGKVSVNGTPLYEPYIAAPPAYNEEWEVPPKALFVLGDNRNNSSDSHQWGPVPMDNVIGKALFIYWPPERWGIIKHLSNVQPSQ
jgi:signal peptidase I